VIRRALLLAALALAGCATSAGPTAETAAPRPAWAIVVHGGAGVIERSAMTPETDAAYRAAMARATAAGTAVLQRGGSALDAIEAAVVLMEDDPLFNAGRGAVFTAEGKNELDASIMDGATLKAGAVAGLTRVRHPIRAARAVMEKSPHVMLIGPGAETFAAGQKLEQVDPGFFFVERRWQGLIQTLRGRGDAIPARPRGAPPAPAAAVETGRDENRFGTVGVVALDQSGRIAAGTSTGGTTGKRFGRVGDAPIIGAGTYADNKSCAVSATGTGEFFIRLTVARSICALVEHRGLPLQAAADQVIQRDLTAIQGDGGVIAVSPRGEMAWSFNTPGMYRARASADAPTPVISIYKDEP
jgi:beta-aspartyl-peptidase (threonine type)